MNFNELKGLKLSSVEQIEDKRVIFNLEDGRKFALHHYQDCCESVNIEDIAGDLSDLVGEVLLAEESSNNDNPKDKYDESHTWTFYRIQTIEGSVVIRWYGVSNGYYSESVYFSDLTNIRDFR